MKKKILFICGSINQTTQMHQIAQALPEYEHFYTPYYADGVMEWLRKWKMVEMSILGDKLRNRCLSYLKLHDLQVDIGGEQHDYDLVLTCSDLIVPSNVANKPMILVQEGMTDPENLMYHLAKTFKWIPRWLASTSTTGLSDAYQYFCVASEGYRDLFLRKGVKSEKIRITGIPNFDNCKKFYDNNFPHKHYVLVCTSDTRETFKYENRKKFIEKCVSIANGRQIIFKLHPNENFKRATKEVNRYAPGALVFSSGNTDEMIANCDALITRFSTTVYVGLALGKEVYSDFPVEELKRMTPIQNNCAAKNIAGVCCEVLSGKRVKRNPMKTASEYDNKNAFETIKTGYSQLFQSFFLKNS